MNLVLSLLKLLVHPPRWMRLFSLLIGSIAVAMLFYLGSKPMAGGLFSHPYDKAAHFVVYAGFATLVWIALGGRSRWVDSIAITTAVLIGTADETVQRMIPTREASLADLLFDMFGAFVAVSILCWLRSRLDPISSDRQSVPEPDPSI
jgi:VanZ family protein